MLLTNVTTFQVFKNTEYYQNLYELINRVQNVDTDKTKLIILFDEIFSLINKNYVVDEDVMTFISQLRKRKIILLTTAQEWSEINISFRKYVRFQVSSRCISLPFSHTAIFVNSVNDGENLKLDTQTMEYIAPTIRTMIFKGNKSIADSYDTYEVIKCSKNKPRAKNKFVNFVGDVPK